MTHQCSGHLLWVPGARHVIVCGQSLFTGAICQVTPSARGHGDVSTGDDDVCHSLSCVTILSHVTLQAPGPQCCETQEDMCLLRGFLRQNNVTMTVLSHCLCCLSRYLKARGCYVTSHPSVTMASWVRPCHDPRDAPEAPVLLLIVTTLQSLVTTGPVTRREAPVSRAAPGERRGCVMSVRGNIRGNRTIACLGSNVNVSVIHPR